MLLPIIEPWKVIHFCELEYWVNDYRVGCESPTFDLIELIKSEVDLYEYIEEKRSSIKMKLQRHDHMYLL